MTLVGSLVNVAHVGGQAGDTQQAGLLVHHGQHFVHGHVGVVGDELHHGGVAGAAAGTHHHAFQGGDAHGGVHALAVHHGAQAGAVAQVGDDDLLAHRIHAQELAHPLAHIAVGGAVEAVAAHAQILVVLIGHAVHEGLGGHGLMEGGVEHGHLGRSGHNGLAGLDAHQVGGVVQGAQRDVLADGRLHLIGDDAGGGELLAAVQHAMAHRADLIHGLDDALLGILQGRQHQLGGAHMVGDLLVDVGDLAVGGLLVQVGALDVDALHQALGDDALVIHVHQLVLQGGRTGVDNQNLHGMMLLLSLLAHGAG